MRRAAIARHEALESVGPTGARADLIDFVDAMSFRQVNIVNGRAVCSIAVHVLIRMLHHEYHFSLGNTVIVRGELAFTHGGYRPERQAKMASQRRGEAARPNGRKEEAMGGAQRHPGGWIGTTIVIEEMTDLYEGYFPTVRELRAEVARWMAYRGLDPSRPFGDGTELDVVCLMLVGLRFGCAWWWLDNVVPPGQAELLRVMIVDDLAPILDAITAIGDPWRDLLAGEWDEGGLPHPENPPWHPVQRWQFYRALSHMILADVTEDLRFQVEAQLRRAERQAPDALQGELFSK